MSVRLFCYCIQIQLDQKAVNILLPILIRSLSYLPDGCSLEPPQGGNLQVYDNNQIVVYNFVDFFCCRFSLFGSITWCISNCDLVWWYLSWVEWTKNKYICTCFVFLSLQMFVKERFRRESFGVWGSDGCEASELPGFDVSPAQGDQRTWPFLKRCLPQLRLLPHPSRSLKSKKSLSIPDRSRNT